MNIFYLKKDEFLKKTNLAVLEKYSDGKVYKSREKYLEHLCGLCLVKTVAEDIYGEKPVKIGIKNSKPFFENSKLQFNISHSKNIVAAAFSLSNTGFDIEHMECRDYKKIMSRIKNNCYNSPKSNDPDRKTFYRFWTTYEAEYKLGEKAVSRYSREIEKEYMFTAVCSAPLLSDFAVYKIS